MRTKNYFAQGFASVLLFLVVAACNESPTDFQDAVELETATSLIHDITLTQVDRMGIPAVNTAFVSSGADKDEFNLGVPADDEAQFSSVLTETIMNRFGLTLGAASGLADFVLPDVLPFGDLSGFPNGRGLEDDVIDVDLSLVFGVFGPPVPALQSDNVDGNDKSFSRVFPYLASPHI